MKYQLLNFKRGNIFLSQMSVLLILMWHEIGKSFIVSMIINKMRSVCNWMNLKTDIRLIEMKKTFMKAMGKLDSRYENDLWYFHVHWMGFTEKGICWSEDLLDSTHFTATILLFCKWLNTHDSCKEFVCQKEGRVSWKKELFIAQVSLFKIKIMKNYEKREYMFSGSVWA